MEAKSKKGSQNLEDLILQRQTTREQGFNSLIEKLSEKYGNLNDVDDSEEYVLPPAKRKRSNTTPKNAKKVNGSGAKSSSARKSSAKK